MDITWTPERAKVADLKLWEQNPRTISEKEYNDLKASITKRGFHDVLKVNTDLTILSGNMRKRALEELGITEVFIMKPSRELTLDEMTVVALESNRHRGEDDWDMLANLDKDLLLEAGFDKLEMAKEFDLRMPIEDDVPPEPKEDPGVKLGDLFQLGDHRLLCGDATKKDDVERLMDGQKADIVLTDPPYGINLETNYSIRNTGGKDYNGLGTKYGTRGNYSKVIGDDKPYEPQHLFDMFPDCREMFLAGADYYSDKLVNRDKGSWYVWDKRVGIEEIKFTASEFEMYWSKTKHLREIIRERWFGAHGTQNQDVKKRSHPTQKPLGVNAFFLKKFAKEEDIIVDPFGGTGACLIACEQLNRKCYMMEIDPKYARVIIDRWENLTGEKVVKL